MLPKVHLTSHSRMSGSRWVITPSWLSGSLISYMYFCHLFLKCSLLLGPYHFCLYCAHLCMNYSLGISNFLEEISSLPLLFFSSLCIDHLVKLSFSPCYFFETLHSNVYSFPFLLCLSLFFFSHLFVRPPQTIILPFGISFCWGLFWSPPPVQFYKTPSIVLQALCLSDLIPWIYSSDPLYNRKGFALGIPYLNQKSKAKILISLWHPFHEMEWWSHWYQSFTIRMSVSHKLCVLFQTMRHTNSLYIPPTSPLYVDLSGPWW